jgi:hypothetical protein
MTYMGRGLVVKIFFGACLAHLLFGARHQSWSYLLLCEESLVWHRPVIVRVRHPVGNPKRKV